MVDFIAQLAPLELGGAGSLRVGAHRLQVLSVGFFGPGANLGVTLGPTPDAPPDYLHELLLAPEHREATYQLVDRWGLLRCLDVRTEHPSYRDVRGRSSKGRLSQGEYYHHDGCTGPRKPRMVEIRFPHQEVQRQVATAVAPFPQSVYEMLRHAHEVFELDAPLLAWHAQLEREGSLPPGKFDTVQGLVTRMIRKELDAEAARAFFRVVDERSGAFREPWQMGESRLISNNHPEHGQRVTMQHRRAYLSEHRGGVANGKLVKRWTAEDLEKAD